MYLRRALFLAPALALALCHSAVAGEITVSQKDKKFDKAKVTAKVGDTIKFVNDDSHTHNVYSKKGYEFNSGIQKPGAIAEIKLDKEGKFTARCAMHPKMKIKITVTQ